MYPYIGGNKTKTKLKAFFFEYLIIYNTYFDSILISPSMKKNVLQNLL